MTLFTIPEIQLKARNKAYAFGKAVNQILSESLRTVPTVASFDIFLSHSFLDNEVILGVKVALEEYGYTVYVDWINDRQLSRDNINSETAQTLRKRMQQSRSLFYATSDNATNSKWMPWELGFKDGHNQKAAVMPLLKTNTSSDSYKGQEYLGVYPYVTHGQDKSGREKLWIHTDENTYVEFDAWLQGHKPTYRS